MYLIFYLQFSIYMDRNIYEALAIVYMDFQSA